MFEQLKLRTIEIMKIFSFGIRKNVAFDGPISLIENGHMSSEIVAQYRLEDKSINNTNNPFEMYYGKSVIEINSENANHIKTLNDYDPKKVYAKAAIVHELVHYYQVGEIDELYGTKYIKPKSDKSNLQEYISQRCELEAHVVQSYFYLDVLYRENLKMILQRVEKSDIIKFKIMIDTYNIVRGMNPIFWPVKTV